MLSKKAKIWYCLWVLILAGIYNLLLFALKSEFAPVHWIAYAFTMFAFVVLLLSGLLPPRDPGRFPMFGISIGLRAAWYFVAQLILGSVILCISQFHYSAGWLLQTLLLAGFIASLALKLMLRQSVSDHDRQINAKVSYIQTMLVDLSAARVQVKDAALGEKLDQLIEQLRYSDPMSHHSLARIEQWIQMDVEALRLDVAAGHTEQAMLRLESIASRLVERNAQCKLLK